MTDLCTPQDVLDRPQLQGLTLGTVREAQIPGYITEASILVQGYLEHNYPEPPDPPEVSPDPIPQAAMIVTARMVARALTSSQSDPSTDTHSSGMGPFTNSQHTAQDALGGGVWLTRQDKMALDSIEGISVNHQTNVAMYDAPRYPSGLVNILHGRTGRPDDVPHGWYG